MNSKARNGSNRSLIWQPDWRGWLPYWIAGALLLPLYGLGILIWIEGVRRWRTSRWIVHDQHVVMIRGSREKTLRLTDMERSRVTRNWLERKFGLGTLVVESTENRWTLPSLKGARVASDTLNQAIQAVSSRNRPKPKRPEAPTSPQRMDRMDELTSLWQQGMITDEEFDRERRHFES